MKRIAIKLFYKLPLPMKIKRKILKTRRNIIGYKPIVDNEVELTDDIDLVKQYAQQVLHIPDMGVHSSSYVPLSDRNYVRQEGDIKLFAYYLTQYHPTKENDAWWGKGVTEWSNVVRAVPQYLGHSQPRIPDELGYYDLRIRDNMARQIELAKQYGVYGFCFYHYWFGEGKRILEKPLNMFLEDKTLQFPFMYCWANHSWYKKFQGTSDEVLIEMPNDEKIYRGYLKAITGDLKDSRYYKIDGKPVIIIYSPSSIPNEKDVLKTWRSDAVNAGFKGLYLIAVHEVGESIDYTVRGYDASCEFHPTTMFNLLGDVPAKVEIVNKAFCGKVYDYKSIVNKKLYMKYKSPTLYRSVMTFWDNTARKNSRSTIFANTCPEDYESWLTDIIEYNRNNSMLEDNIGFINAWNEWGEGAYLEPDKEYGYALLEKTRDAIENKRV